VQKDNNKPLSFPVVSVKLLSPSVSLIIILPVSFIPVSLFGRREREKGETRKLSE